MPPIHGRFLLDLQTKPWLGHRAVSEKSGPAMPVYGDVIKSPCVFFDDVPSSNQTWHGNFSPCIDDFPLETSIDGNFQVPCLIAMLAKKNRGSSRESRRLWFIILLIVPIEGGWVNKFQFLISAPVYNHWLYWSKHDLYSHCIGPTNQWLVVESCPAVTNRRSNDPIVCSRNEIIIIIIIIITIISGKVRTLIWRYYDHTSNFNRNTAGWWFEPLWKIWLRQLGWLFIPNINGKIKKMATKPPTRSSPINSACTRSQSKFTQKCYRNSPAGSW